MIHLYNAGKPTHSSTFNSKVMAKFLLILAICFHSFIATAQFTTYVTASNFNAFTGKVHVEAFAFDANLALPGYYYAKNAKVYYSLDNSQTWVLFYSYSLNAALQLVPSETQSWNGQVVTANLWSAADPTRPNRAIMSLELEITNQHLNMTDIKVEFDTYYAGSKFSQNISPTSVTIPKMQPISISVSPYFIEDGKIKAKINYTKASLSAVDEQSKIYLENINGSRSSPDVNVVTSGYAVVEASEFLQINRFKQQAYDGRLTASSDYVKVLPFTVPKYPRASYDATQQRVTFTWNMDRVLSNEYVADQLKIQIADNANFDNAKTVYVAYDPAQETYNYNVDKDFSPNMHFRVARDHTGFGWEVSQQADATVGVSTIAFATATVTDQKEALITWDNKPSAWLPGASFIITRINNTAKTSSEIKLTKQDFDLGSYTDKLVAICNNYSYTVQVLPPAGAGFATPDPVAATGQVLPTEIGTISNLEVSKGYYPDRTELSWSATGNFDNFIIKRAVYGTNNFVQIALVPGSSVSDYQADDSKGTPGVYYTYQVVGLVKCNGVNVFSNETLSGIGFRSPTGNIYGRITYESGQAVDDAVVRLQSNDAAQLGKSIYLNGSSDSYLKLDNTTVPFSDDAFTIETWIKPGDAQPVNQVLFHRGNQYEMGFDAGGQLYFSYKNEKVSVPYDNPNNTFVHVAGIHKGDSLLIIFNEDVIGRKLIPVSTSSPDPSVYIGSGGPNQYLYKGYLDEMRVFNLGLETSDVVKNQTRILAGNEPGLIAYWRFDETIIDQFYDLSYHDENYNRNDGTMSSTAVTRSSTIPTAGQLALKAYTDVSGNYLISGIPYIGNGTTYTIVPLKGTHQFDPISVNRLISPATPQFTVDFKDKSSFPVTGIVYYRNTTVPVPGVQFLIDGRYAQKSNGEVIETNETGAFNISVPVGVHEVKSVKINHVFENDGKITLSDGTNRNYQAPVAGLELHDTTTIRFIGRVAAGAVQSGLPLGLSASKNNLGDNLKVTLQLPESVRGAQMLDISGSPRGVIINHLLPSNINDPSKSSKTIVTFNERSIDIEPDPKTGEFVADLIPVLFEATSVTAMGWGQLLENGNPVTLNFTNKFALVGSSRHYEDSILNNQNVYVKHAYFDSITYNASYKFIKRVNPTFAIFQKDQTGQPLSYLGNSEYELLLGSGEKQKIPVVDKTKSGRDMYVFGYPVFVQNQLYSFGIKVFEEYQYNKEANNAIDEVPTTDGLVSVQNHLRNGENTPDTVSLNSEGQAEYSFTGGDPDLSTGQKDISASIHFGDNNDVNWQLYGDENQLAYLLGGKLSGTDFVTAGPDKIITVLRDPPGSKSFSYLEKGSTLSKSVSYSGSVDQEGDIDLAQKLGYTLTTFIGFGAGVINTVETNTGVTLGLHHEEHYTRTNSKEESTTLTTKFQTSDDPLFAGPIADVFVGYSTNITYGASNNVTIVKDKKPNDIELKQVDIGGIPYYLVFRQGINIGESFGTLFAYPQQQIEKILIPNLITIRNSFLNLPGSMTSGQAQNLANAQMKPVYLSRLETDASNFGKSNNDVKAFPQSAKTQLGAGPSYDIYFPAGSIYRTDTVLMLNQYVTAWEKRMADNEKAKLESSLIQNYSFHAGAPIEYSQNTSIASNYVNDFSFILSGSVANSGEVKFNGSGIQFNYKESLGTTQGGSTSDGSATSTTVGFSLGSNGTDDYFTLDLRKAADNSLVFRTKGGISGCPYMGATMSKYYQPGTLIDQPTQRIEVPVITVDRPVANNVPTSRKAVYTITVRNESEAKQPATFVIGYTDVPQISGATLAIDGASIGGGGRSVYLLYGESITKTLTLTRGPDAMDYENIPILLHSSCQYDPTGYQEKIADTVLISAHFIPSCTDISIKSPKSKWVLNSESPLNQDNKRYLPISIDQFDVNNSLFDHVELQYKPASSSTWVSAMKFFYDQAKLDGAQGEKQLIADPKGIAYNLVMADGSFNDQAYDIQAVSYCKVGNNFITTESSLVSGVKDTYNPRLFGSPQPADGVLTATDDVRLNFNETIAAGLLTAADFKVTGIRNGATGDHSASVRLDGVSNYLATEFEKSFTGKNITAEMWVLPSGVANQTVFSHGNADESLELALTSEQKMKVTLGTKVVTSSQQYDYKPGEWAHVAVMYNDVTKTVSAYYNFKELISAAPVTSYAGSGHIEYGRSISKKNDFLNGKIHEARIWNDTISAIKLQVNSLKVLSGSENALLAYYPMNEGKGSVAFDKAHGSNALLNGNWSTPAGKSVAFNGSRYVQTNASFAPVVSAMDYTLEMWFKAGATQGNSTLASNGTGEETDPVLSVNLFTLGFENGLLTYRNNGFKVSANGNYLDNNWHHVAVAVDRNAGIAQLSVDGLLNQFFDANNVGGIASDYTYLGARGYFENGSARKIDRYFTGQIDEFRLWNTYLDPTIIARNNNIRLQGTEIGLLAYYPFERYTTFQGATELNYSLKDAKVQEVQTVEVPDAVVNVTDPLAMQNDNAAPIKDRGPVENLKYNFVVNNDALIINMEESKQAIDKTTITFQVKNVRDLNGNKLLSPVTWTAYVDKNLLKWGDREINLVKETGNKLQFESYLVNSGGSTQQYTIYNLPTWLKASTNSGSVGPKANQKVVFTVNEGLNIGSYEEIIYMRNDNNEIEALKITLQVKGKKPDWIVKASDYDYNMVVYGKIRLNNIFSINKEDMLGAFINGRCVGVANNTFNASNNLWYTFLTVYNDDIKNTNVEFRIWQAGTGKTYKALPSKAIIFANDAVIGTPAIPVIFDGSTQYFQDITINQNWNWLSFNLAIPTGTPINTILQNGVWTVADIVKNEAPGKGDEKGFASWVDKEEWKGSLKTIDNLSLYKLKAANAQALTITGVAVNVTTTPIPLKGAQWNYISYLPQINTTVKEALAGYEAADEDVIKSQTGFAMYSKQSGWVGSLTTLETGKGYMLYRKPSTSTSFKYPAITGSLGGTTPRGVNPNPNERPVPANYSNSDNMTITAVVGHGFEFKNGDSILAFVNGVLMGKTKPVYNPEINKHTYFFTISGDTEQPVVFVVERNGEWIAQSTTIVNYQSNTTVGTLLKPVELRFVQQGEMITVYPNPFNSSATISVNLRSLSIGDHRVQVTIMDLSGRLVKQMPLKTVSGTGFTSTWNGTNASGTPVSKGVYFITTVVDGVPYTRKVVKQ